MQIVHPPKPCKIHARSRAGFRRQPVLLDFFLNNAIEVDVDCVSDGKMWLSAASCSTSNRRASTPATPAARCRHTHKRRNPRRNPPPNQSDGVRAGRGRTDERAVCRAGRRGVRVEVNPRASRTVLVSKATGVPLAKVGARCMAGISERTRRGKEVVPDFYAVKEAVFPFIKFPGVDTI